MTENLDNVIIEPLKALRSDLQTLHTEMHMGLKDVKMRFARVETAFVSIKHEMADSRGDYVRQQVA